MSLEYKFDKETEESIEKIDYILSRYRLQFFKCYSHLSLRELERAWLNDNYRNELTDMKMELVNLTTKVVIRIPNPEKNL